MFHPLVAFCIIWVAVLCLSMVEGGQASLIGLAPVQRDLYKDSHPIAHKCIEIAYQGNNLDRYLLGRQFMVVIIIFIINLAGAPLPGAELWGFPSIMTDIFLDSGLAMILFTAMIGQLSSQVNAAHCMLDYINNYLALFTLYAGLTLEFSGLLHSSHLIQMMIGKSEDRQLEPMKKQESVIEKSFFWFRCFMSFALLGFSLIVTSKALFNGQTTMWDGVPNFVSFILFFVFMNIVSLLEGMQIAFFAVSKLPMSERGDADLAQKTCELLFYGDGRNLPGFMIGRQLFVVSCFFVIARVITINVNPEDDNNIFGVSDGVQVFFNSGLLGAIITTIFGSILCQLVASTYPIALLSNPFVYVFLRICLWIEATGLSSGAWVIALIHKKIAGFQRDEVYIGTVEERAEMNMNDDYELLRVGSGHLLKLPGFIEGAPKSVKELCLSSGMKGSVSYLNSHLAVEVYHNEIYSYHTM